MFKRENEIMFFQSILLERVGISVLGNSNYTSVVAGFFVFGRYEEKAFKEAIWKQFRVSTKNCIVEYGYGRIIDCYDGGKGIMICKKFEKKTIPITFVELDSDKTYDEFDWINLSQLKIAEK